MSYETRFYPFDSGYHQETDDRMLEPGQPRVIENLRKLKNGALGMRLDYDALAVTTPSGNGCKLFDVHEFNSRLVGFGCVSAGSFPVDLYEFVNQPQFAWRPTDFEEQPRLCLVTNLRNMGRVPGQSVSASIVDVGAVNGLVCMAFVGSQGVTVHIFDPATDSTVFIQTIVSATAPHVCAVSVGSAHRFFITMKPSAGTSVALYRYDPATDNALVQLTDAFAAGGAVTHVDAYTAQLGNEFWVGIARNGTPAITLKRFNSSGAAVQSITGPTVSVDHFAVFGQLQRVHLLTVESDGHVDFYTYELGGGTLEHSTFDLESGVVTDRQPTINTDGGGVDLLIFIQDVSGPNVIMSSWFAATHVFGGSRQWSNTELNSKPLVAAGTEFFAGFQQETNKAAATGSNYLGCVGITKPEATEMICAYTDKLIAFRLDATGNRMPTIALDAVTGKAYWVRTIVDDDGRSYPVVGEFSAGSTARRQTALVGDVLYITGGVVQACDGRQLFEAAFFERPRILSATGTTGGSKKAGMIKQLAAVVESFDSKGKKTESSPGEVKEVTLGASDTAISVSVVAPKSYRQNGTNQRYGSGVRIVLYETLDTRKGDFTLQRSGSFLLTNHWQFGATATITLKKSDTDLSDEDVIYTQGDRGELSGPLPFDSPEPATYAASSADTLLTGGCPEGSRVQESRPQFIGEELNWSDEIGFQRDTRGDVLAVWRLDERRIIFTASEIFEQDGQGLDDNGQGDLGAPRRLPSDVGLYGGRTGWQSLVEFKEGLFFQGKADLIYLLPRGGTVPVPQLSIRSILASYPTITSASYIPQTESVRFTCNNIGGTDGVVLVYDASHKEWFTEGPFGAPLVAGCGYQGRAIILIGGVAYRQRVAQPPAAFLAQRWRSGPIRASGHGKWSDVFGVHFYGTFRGNFQIQCVLYFDGGSTVTGGATETLETVSVTGLADGDQFHYRFAGNQMQCENVEVEFLVTALSGAATAGVEYNFWAIEARSSSKAALPAPSQMS